MKLSISNIAWSKKDDAYMYGILKNLEYKGLEIAPTRIFPENPYDQISQGRLFKNKLLQDSNLSISSLQSIWYGKNEEIFRSSEERERLLDYTKKAIDFASSLSCQNLVFGCPKNRNIKEASERTLAIDFFRELGAYAFSKGTVLALEANPPIYGTNFINTTTEALELIKEVNSPGFLLNLDTGTMIYNEELPENLNFSLINHVHISEPGMNPIIKRELHRQLFQLLKEHNYMNYISIEMKTQDTLTPVLHSLEYIKGLNDEN